jgi:small subunit ribosomal protein S12
MITKRQLIRGARQKKKIRKKYPDLRGCPQVSGICVKVVKNLAPKKPNSAMRAEARVKLKSGKIVRAYVSGENGMPRDFGRVLIQAGAAQDLPGQKYNVIHGARDCPPAAGHAGKPRKNKRSLYGVKKSTQAAIGKAGKK